MDNRLIAPGKDRLRNLFPHQKISISRILYDNPLQHLFDNDFNVFVINLDTLQSVDFLNLIHQIFLEFLLSQNVKNVVRVGGTVHEGFTSSHPVTFMDIHIFATWDEILPFFTTITCHNYLTRTALEAGKPHYAINF
jgi:hypothetical protein